MAKKPVKKPIGYTKEQTSSMRQLIERMVDPFSGDVTGGSSITVAKKKPVKKMKSGGIVKAPARSYRDMRAGAGSGVGRIQKTKIARGR